MSLIYSPKGKAGEYSPLALNIYSGGCDHACKYCYCIGMNKFFGKEWTNIPTPRNLSGLKHEASKASRQILMCFVGDPYCSAEVKYGKTREALNVLKDFKCSVSILTKGGSRLLRDMSILKNWPNKRISVGATLTFDSVALSRQWEPGAADPDDRILALKEIHDSGIKTWASIEPVIVPSESMSIIEKSLPYVDEYKIGKWNHDERSTNIEWKNFGENAVKMIRSYKKALYVKNDLRSHFSQGFLKQNETNMGALFIGNRK